LDAAETILVPGAAARAAARAAKAKALEQFGHLILRICTTYYYFSYLIFVLVEAGDEDKLRQELCA